MYTVTEILLEERNPVEAVIVWTTVFETPQAAIAAIKTELKESYEDMDDENSFDGEFEEWGTDVDLTQQTIELCYFDVQAYLITKCEVSK